MCRIHLEGFTRAVDEEPAPCHKRAARLEQRRRRWESFDPAVPALGALGSRLGCMPAQGHLQRRVKRDKLFRKPPRQRPMGGRRASQCPEIPWAGLSSWTALPSSRPLPCGSERAPPGGSRE